jgi:hypothetical protein
MSARDDFDGSPDPGICVSCGREVTPEWVDEGIGPYEFWGDKGTHHDWCCKSPCCGAEVVEGEEHLVSKTVHTARKDHKIGDINGAIKRGDRYRKWVYVSWIRGGRRFYNVEKLKIGGGK